jgi:DNA-binding response OmpR family regulator
MKTPTRVLVIDDDPCLIDLLKLSVDPAQYDVIAANTGSEGIEATLSYYPDIIILDLVLPGTDGWQIGRTIRKWCKAPILVLSAFDKPGMVARALDGGADDFLIKPVSMDVLIAHVNTLCRRSRVINDTIPTRSLNTLAGHPPNPLGT